MIDEKFFHSTKIRKRKKLWKIFRLNALKFKPQKSQKSPAFDIKTLFIIHKAHKS